MIIHEKVKKNSFLSFYFSGWNGGIFLVWKCLWWKWEITKNNTFNSLEKEMHVGRMYWIVWKPQNVSILSLDKARVRINVEREFSNTHCLWIGDLEVECANRQLQNIIEVARLNVNLACYSIQPGRIEMWYLKNFLLSAEVIIYRKNRFNETKGKLWAVSFMDNHTTIEKVATRQYFFLVCFSPLTTPV